MANGIGQKILGFLSGGFADKSLGLISKVVKDKDQANQLAHEFQTLVATEAHELALQAEEHDLERERMFNERTRDLEGTAGDLKSIPFIGAIVIFLRGAFRPLFAYFVAYLNFVYFVTGMNWTPRQEALLTSVTIIVLLFFFGERAVKNVLPILVQMFAGGKIGKGE